jgi:4-carboxymuconolactone decarboxylase
MTPDQRKVYDKIVSGKRGRIQGPLRAALAQPGARRTLVGAGRVVALWDDTHATAIGTRDPDYGPSLPIALRVVRAPAGGGKAGLPVDVIDAIFAGATPPAMSAEDSAVYHYALELNRYRSVSDKTYARALELFGDRTVVN